MSTQTAATDAAWNADPHIGYFVARTAHLAAPQFDAWGHADLQANQPAIQAEFLKLPPASQQLVIQHVHDHPYETPLWMKLTIAGIAGLTAYVGVNALLGALAPATTSATGSANPYTWSGSPLSTVPGQSSIPIEAGIPTTPGIGGASLPGFASAPGASAALPGTAMFHTAVDAALPNTLGQAVQAAVPAVGGALAANRVLNSSGSPDPAAQQGQHPAASRVPPWLKPAALGTLAAVQRFLPQSSTPGTGSPGGLGDLSPDMQAILQEFARRVTNQAPLADAVTRQALAGLPRTQ